MSQKRLETKIQKEQLTKALVMLIAPSMISKEQSNSISRVLVSQKRLETKIQKE